MYLWVLVTVDVASSDGGRCDRVKPRAWARSFFGHVDKLRNCMEVVGHRNGIDFKTEKVLRKVTRFSGASDQCDSIRCYELLIATTTLLDMVNKVKVSVDCDDCVCILVSNIWTNLRI